jgi:hypothetical protein
LATPITLSIREGPIPMPTADPPATVGDDVTNG